VFPKKKRCRLEGVLQTYLRDPVLVDYPEVITGLAAEFLHYYRLVTTDPSDENKKVEPSQSDKRTFALCKEFEKSAERHLKKLRFARVDKKERKEEQQAFDKSLKQVLKARARQEANH
jgi:hypothetical protein